MSLILSDAQLAPDLFRWNGPIDRHRLVDWMEGRGWVLPSDLLDLWASTGGGEIFESENILPPLTTAAGENELDCVTDWCRTHGAPDGLVVFHQGLGYTAVRFADGAYLSLDGNSRVLDQHRSLEHWYLEVLRAEYGERYGLPTL